jgi:hypothetical protein
MVLARQIAMTLPELAFLACLVAVLVGGRDLTQVAVPDMPVFVTDAALALTACGAAVRGGLLARLGSEDRCAVPWALIGVYWALGAIAAVRGLTTVGMDDAYFVARDFSLVYYSSFMILTILVFRTRESIRRLFWALAAGSVMAGLLGLVGLRVELPLVLIAQSQGVAVSFLALALFARWTGGRRPPVWLLAIGALQVALIFNNLNRALFVALAAALLVLLVTAPQRGRRGALVAGLVAIALVGGVTAVLRPDAVSGIGGSGPVEKVRAKAVNSSWRLAFWSYDIRRAAERPFTGIGFGPPSNFVWEGQRYDLRRTRDPNEITGPHNSFVNILFRAGFPAAAVMLLLIAMALRRAARALSRARAAVDVELAEAIRVAVAFFVFNTVTASFSVSLEAPFLAIPFWVALGTIYTVVRLSPSPYAASSSSAGSLASRNVRSQISRLSSA